LTKQQINPTAQHTDQQQNERGERVAPAAERKPFVEPSVSVPTDVLEATALFQDGPSVLTSNVNP